MLYEIEDEIQPTAFSCSDRSICSCDQSNCIMQCSCMLEEQMHTNSQMERSSMERDPTLPPPHCHCFIMACLLKRRFVAGSFMDFRFRRSKILCILLGPGRSLSQQLEGPWLQVCRHSDSTRPGPGSPRRGQQKKLSRYPRWPRFTATPSRS